MEEKNQEQTRKAHSSLPFYDSVNIQSESQEITKKIARKYTRVSYHKQQSLIKLITIKHFSIIKAANQSGIAYGAAKKIFARFRKGLQNNFFRLATSNKRAQYTCSKSSFQAKVKIISTIGGHTRSKRGRKLILHIPSQ